jgi:hypothetical protein
LTGNIRQIGENDDPEKMGHADAVVREGQQQPLEQQRRLVGQRVMRILIARPAAATKDGCPGVVRI